MYISLRITYAPSVLSQTSYSSSSAGSWTWQKTTKYQPMLSVVLQHVNSYCSKTWTCVSTYKNGRFPRIHSAGEQEHTVTGEEQGYGTHLWWTQWLIFETEERNVRPTWGWVSVAKNVTAQWWALEIACKGTMWVIVLGVCENARGLWLCDFTSITCVLEGTGSSVTTNWNSK